MDLSLLYQELRTRRGLEVSTWLFQIHWIWYISTNSSRSIFWIQKIFCLMMRWRSYAGMLVLTYDVSAMCQDLNLFLLEADSKDPVELVCHQTYTSHWLFTKLHHLAILGDSTKPWPMTLAPTNETIRHEISGIKTQRVKHGTTMIQEYQG